MTNRTQEQLTMLNSEIVEISNTQSQALRTNQRGWLLWVKIGVDRCMALCGLLVLSPGLICLSILVWISMGRPIFFRQRRAGRSAKVFTVFKFRTMSDQRDATGELLPDAERLTRIGRFLRATSLDEFPQLWNILLGDISLVGPRPLLVEYLPRYSKEQARRHDVMPGITGWAQINGRNSLKWEKRLELDTWYVDHWTLMLDARILLKTIAVVLKREGIGNSDHATMPEFKAEQDTASLV
jgi:sugar transferase EpsL